MAEAVGSQCYKHEPRRERRLCDDIGPEIEWTPECEESAVEYRAANLQRAFERTSEIATGIIKHERKAVVEGRPNQRGDHQDEGDGPGKVSAMITSWSLGIHFKITRLVTARLQYGPTPGGHGALPSGPIVHGAWAQLDGW